MKIEYLEIVTADVDAVCAALSSACGGAFNDTVEALGNARVMMRPDGSRVGVRRPMSEQEEPVTRVYWQVGDIEAALKDVVAAGGEVMHPPLELPGLGTFAIYFLGGIQQGLWQVDR